MEIDTGSGVTIMPETTFKEKFPDMKLKPSAQILKTFSGTVITLAGPALFQKHMEEMLAGIEGVQVFIDDIQITGSNEQEHMETVDKVLQRLEENGVRLNKEKCSFLQDSIDYLGHHIDEKGLHPQEDKIKAMQEALRPENVKELRSFLGGVQYYGKFLPNLSATLKPQNELLHKDKEWKWSDACEKSFRKVKELLSSRTVLVHYDPQLPLILATDASIKGLGAVISHKMPTDIAEETRKDAVLSKVLQYTLTGWPNCSEDDNVKPFFQRREEITTEAGVLQWGLRVIIPQKYRNRILYELHEGYLGMNKTKAMARSYVYWPKIDLDIEKMVKDCHRCAEGKNMPAAAPVFAWTFPSNPWERIYVDFWEYEGQKYLVLIDAYSKWPEVIPMTTTTAQRTNDVLKQIFAIHGLPVTLVSDNGPPFRSSEFEEFLQKNGVQNITSQPYMPSTNGSAKRLVQSFKRLMKSSSPGQSGPQRLSKILLQLRTTPHMMTGKSPAELLFKRKIRIRLDLMKPDLVSKMRHKQEAQAQGKILREFQPGDTVKVRNYRPGVNRWTNGVILQRLETHSYSVRVGGTVRHCHINQLQSAPDSTADINELPPPLPTVPMLPMGQDEEPTVPPSSVNPDTNQDATQGQASPQRSPPRRYPKRVRRPVQRMDL
ncbi:uncharacterized protein K02A2.6-like [Aplysia californica]|uniref:Uncharacterized protein K02A2.6-like n=1 Tax=Aplysia californica TaxID=6500 RepID=A0ABM0JCP6_APLCA|nr:uncharacterized protein K02A2.6-like [Aplysia californica]